MLITLKETDEITDDVFVSGYSLGGCLATEIGIENLPFVTGIGIFNSCDFKNTVLNELVTEKFEEFDPMKPMALILGPKNDVTALETFELYPQKPESGHADLYAAAQYDTPDLSQINVPILFVTGESDRLAELENVLKLQLSVPTSRLHVIPFRGHSSFLEVKEEYAESILDFFKYGIER